MAMTQPMGAVHPWIFHHLPKTAGSSIVEDFQSLLSPYYTVFVPRRALATGMGYHEAFDVEFFRFARTTLRVNYQFVSGHFFRHHVQWFACMPEARIFTFLRDPLKRLISEYRYQQTPSSGDWKGFLERYPSFDHFLKDPSRHNTMANSIAGKGATAGEAIKVMTEEYFFYGITERYEESAALLLRLAGSEHPPKARNNVTAKEVPMEIADPDRYRAVVEALNEQDAELYRFARENAEQQLDRVREAAMALSLS
jgi:hypothetical protein